MSGPIIIIIYQKLRILSNSILWFPATMTLFKKWIGNYIYKPFYHSYFGFTSCNPLKKWWYFLPSVLQLQLQCCNLTSYVSPYMEAPPSFEWLLSPSIVTVPGFIFLGSCVCTFTLGSTVWYYIQWCPYYSCTYTLCPLSLKLSGCRKYISASQIAGSNGLCSSSFVRCWKIL